MKQEYYINALYGDSNVRLRSFTQQFERHSKLKASITARALDTMMNYAFDKSAATEGQLLEWAGLCLHNAPESKERVFEQALLRLSKLGLWYYQSWPENQDKEYIPVIPEWVWRTACYEQSYSYVDYPHRGELLSGVHPDVQKTVSAFMYAYHVMYPEVKIQDVKTLYECIKLVNSNNVITVKNAGAEHTALYALCKLHPTLSTFDETTLDTVEELGRSMTRIQTMDNPYKQLKMVRKFCQEILSSYTNQEITINNLIDALVNYFSKLSTVSFAGGLIAGYTGMLECLLSKSVLSFPTHNLYAIFDSLCNLLPDKYSTLDSIYNIGNMKSDLVTKAMVSMALLLSFNTNVSYVDGVIVEVK